LPTYYLSDIQIVGDLFGKYPGNGGFAGSGLASQPVSAPAFAPGRQSLNLTDSRVVGLYFSSKRIISP